MEPVVVRGMLCIGEIRLLRGVPPGRSYHRGGPPTRGALLAPLLDMPPSTARIPDLALYCGVRSTRSPLVQDTVYIFHAVFYTLAGDM